MIWMIIGFAVLFGFLVYWVVSSEIEERDAWNREAYIECLENILRMDRRRRNSSEDLTEK